MNPLRNRHCLASLLIGLAPGLLVAGDWPQWRGPLRNGISTETAWFAAWPSNQPPRVAWRAQVGKGHAAISISGGRAVTAGWNGQEETVFCFDARSGQPLWKQSYPSTPAFQWPGTRGTPTVDGHAVYTLSQQGSLRAWDTKDGRLRWTVELNKNYQPDKDYGFPWSPLVAGDHLVFCAGAKGLAVNKATGAFAWGNDGRNGTCASTVPFAQGGTRGVAVLVSAPDRNSVSVIGVDPATGRELWRSTPWREKWGAVCSDLIFESNRFFLTSAEQYPRCARFTIRGATATEDWSNAKLAIYTGGGVLLGSSLFGVSKAGLLKCLDWDTGEEKWSQRGFGEFGALIAADDKLLVQTSDSGELVVVAGAADGYREIRRVKVLAREPKTFTPPVLANGCIFCRSYAGEVVCLNCSAP
jgi:outer membrane protein assembly factor BamB